MDLFKFKDKTSVHPGAALPVSTLSSRIVLIATLSISILVLVVVFFYFENTTRSSDISGRVEVPVSASLDTLGFADASTLDAVPNISDFNQQLSALDDRLLALEHTVVQANTQLTASQDSWSAQFEEVKQELAELKQVALQLSDANKHLAQTLSTVQLELSQDDEVSVSSVIPMHGLNLLSVSMWDDGAIAIVSLGSRTTGLSPGDFVAGLKVEAMSVAEQSLTLYQPATDKLYKLHANSIVYKELGNDHSKIQ